MSRRQINATAPPAVQLTAALPKNAGPGFTLTAPLNVTFLIQCTSSGGYMRGGDCQAQPAFTLGLGVYAALTARTKSGVVLPNTTTPATNVTGHLLDLEFNVSLASTHIGNFSMTNLDMLIDMMLRAVALDLVGGVAGSVVVCSGLHLAPLPPAVMLARLPCVGCDVHVGSHPTP